MELLRTRVHSLVWGPLTCLSRREQYFDAQAQQTFENLDRVLRAGGSSLKNVIKVTIFLTDMARFDKIVELRGRWFTPPYPADTIVEVRSLYSPDAMIEIEAIAVADDAAQRT